MAMKAAIEAKHTPGPWRFSKEPGHMASIESDYGTVSIPCWNGTTAPQIDANARLISAAPQILEALESIVGEWRTTQNLWRMEEFIQLAEGAISKAGGL